MRLVVWISLLMAVVGAGRTWGQNQFEVLVVAASTKYHFEYTAVARASFAALAQEHQFGLTWRNDPASLPEDWSPFQAIVLLNTPGDLLPEAMRLKLEAFVARGGGVVAVHRAVFKAPGWPWYEALLGRTFRIHPHIQTALMTVEDPDFPAVAHWPRKVVWTDEWYEFDEVPGVRVRDVLTVDETTYDPTKIWPGQKAAGMGAHHPIAWAHEVGAARVFVTALGHRSELYANPAFLQHLYGGLYWVVRGAAAQKP